MTDSPFTNHAATDQPAEAPVQSEQPTSEVVLLQQLEEYKNAAKRATADYRNLQRETEQKIAAVGKFATEDLLLELCPLVDYFNSALAAVPADQQDQGWVKGIKHIYDYLLNVLRNHQLERLVTIGQIFDPLQHETVGSEASDQPEQTILKEVQAGFSLNGKVIRPARVIIATVQKQK